MKRNKTKQLTLISNIISLVTSIFVSFFVTKYIVETLSKEAYSFYPTAANISSYCSILFVSTTSISARLIVIPYLKKNYKEAREYYSTIFISYLLLSLVIIVLELAIYINLENILNIPNSLIKDVKGLFLMMFINTAISGFCGVYTNVFYVKDRMDLYAITTILESIVKAISIIYLYFNKNITLTNFGLVILISTISRCLLTFIFSCKYMGDIKISFKSLSIKKFNQVFKLSLMSFISNSFYQIINNSILIISNIYIGIESSSNLSLVQPLTTVCLLLATTITTMIEPKAIRFVSNNDDKSFNNLNIVLMSIVVVPIILIATLSKQFFSLWLPNEDFTLLSKLSFMNSIIILLCYINFLYSSTISTLLKEKVKAIGGAITIFLFAIFEYVLIKWTKLGNIAILLGIIVSYLIYFVIYLPIVGDKLIKENNKSLKLNQIKNYLYVIVVVCANLLISSFIKTGSYTWFIVLCFIALILDYFIFLLAYKLNFKKLFSLIINTING